MERKEAIRSAYRLTGGNNFYDGMITCSTLSGKAVCHLVWDMNQAECDAYLENALSGIRQNNLLIRYIPMRFFRQRSPEGQFATLPCFANIPAGQRYEVNV